jgi:hypothetical protein
VRDERTGQRLQPDDGGSLVWDESGNISHNLELLVAFLKTLTDGYSQPEK